MKEKCKALLESKEMKMRYLRFAPEVCIYYSVELDGYHYSGFLRDSS